MELRGALSGIRVLDNSRGVAGPYCTMLLADMGADVVMIEDPDMGAKLRSMGGLHLQGKDGAFFVGLNRNKKSITLSLLRDKGRKLLLDLAGKADVFVENSRPGVVEKLGVDYDTLSSINPRIVYCSISGFGQSGPLRTKGGIDPLLQAFSGAMSVTGERGGRPLLNGVSVADIGGGMMAAYGTVVALLARGQTGSGQKVDVSLLDALVSMQTPNASLYLASGQVPEPSGDGYGRFAPYQVYRAKDRDIFLAITREDEWARFCQVVGLGSLAIDPRFISNTERFEHREELQTIIERALMEKSAEEWLAALDAAKVRCAPVNNFKQLFEDPQVVHNEMLVNMNHPDAGPIKVVGIPVKLGKTPGKINTPSPSFGQHTEEVLTGMLNLSREEIESLKVEGVV